MNEMISSGIELMVTGMGIVFLFLAMLVVAVNMMSWTVQRYFPQTPESDDVSNSHTTEANVVAAITAAVHQYRKKHK